MDFITIQNHVSDFVIDVPATTLALIPTFVNKAIRDSDKRPYNFKHMEAESALIVTVEGTRQLAAKTALWKEKREFAFFTSDDTGKTDEIEWAPSESEMVRRYPATTAPTTSRGSPDFILEKGDATFGTLQLYPVPDGKSDYSDGDYRITVPFWTFLADLSADGDTNWWTDNFPWYVIWQATSEAQTRNQDYDNAKVFAAKAEFEYRLARKSDIKASGGSDRLHLSRRGDVFGSARGRRRT